MPQKESRSEKKLVCLADAHKGSGNQALNKQDHRAGTNSANQDR